jgi:soluble lytic murein transglycosylase-like protein
MQGVGPLQLTWYEFQDRADARGGAWKPYINMDVGFEHLGQLIKSTGDLDQAVARYNGTGAAANDYARQVLQRAGKIHKRLADCG